MKTIYKYPVHIGRNAVLRMPKGAVILDVQVQPQSNHIHPLHGEVGHQGATAWALVETNNEMVNYSFHVIGTGHQIPEFTGICADNYVGTFQTNGGMFVWHVFGGEVAQ